MNGWEAELAIPQLSMGNCPVLKSGVYLLKNMDLLNFPLVLKCILKFKGGYMVCGLHKSMVCGLNHSWFSALHICKIITLAVVELRCSERADMVDRVLLNNLLQLLLGVCWWDAFQGPWYGTETSRLQREVVRLARSEQRVCTVEKYTTRVLVLCNERCSLLS